MRTWLLASLAALTAVSCKKDSKPADPVGSATASSVPKPPPADAAAPLPPADDEATPSLAALEKALGGTPLVEGGAAISADGTKAAICTTGDNGQADMIEEVCHLATVGKGKAQTVQVLAFDDSAVLDGTSDKPDPAAQKKVTDKLVAAVDTIKQGLGAAPRPMPAACEVWSASHGSPEDPPCVVGGVTVALGDNGKVTAGTIKDQFTVPASSVKNCSYDASGGAVYFDDKTRVAMVAIEFTNPSDDCDLVTQYEVHALSLPAK